MKQILPQCMAMALAVIMLQACSNSDAKTSNSTTATSTQSKASTASTKPTSGKFDTDNVSFKINGVQAFRAFDKADKPIAQVNADNDNLSIYMHGDIKDGVLQGMLHLRKMPFNKTTGVVAGATATYIRYLDERGGKSISYSCKNILLNLSKCEQKPNGPVGEEWEVSGTFSGDFKVISYDEQIAVENGSDRELKITDGQFDNLLLVVLGKKK